MSVRFYSALLLGLMVSAAPALAQTADTAPAIAAPSHPAVKHATGRRGLGAVSSFSLDPVGTTEPLIRQASLTVKAPVTASRDGFSDAPLPDDDVDAPKERGANDDARLKADFFQRNHHQVGDALAGGAGANDQRRGHGAMAAGVAVAIPLD